MAVLVLVAACGSPDSAPLVDAGQGPIDYRLHVLFDTTRTDMPHVFIDGVETMDVQTVYPDLSTPIQHEIELRYADQVLARMPTHAAPGDCGQQDTVWSSISQSVEALVSGDLRYLGDEWRGDLAACTGDGFGIARCYCDATERCEPRILRTTPLFTQMACTPIGPKAAGDPCTLTDDPAGAYDDCGTDLACYEGTCHALCRTQGCATTCLTPDGYPPEGALCM